MMSAKLAPIAICCSSFIYLGFIRDRLAVEDALRALFLHLNSIAAIEVGNNSVGGIKHLELEVMSLEYSIVEWRFGTIL